MFSGLKWRWHQIATIPLGVFAPQRLCLSEIGGRRGIVHLKNDNRPTPPLIVPLSIRQELFGLNAIIQPIRGGDTMPIFSNIYNLSLKNDEYSYLFESEDGGKSLLYDDEDAVVGHSLESTKRKRLAKMNKHKYRKRLKKSKFLRRSLGQA